MDLLRSLKKKQQNVPTQNVLELEGKVEKKEKQISIEKVVEATKTAKDIQNDSSLIFAEDLKQLTKNLTLLINEFNLKNKAEEKSLKNVELNSLNNKLEFEFIAKLYKVSNNYQKISNIPDILNQICRDVCEEFMYDVSLLITWEKDSLIMFESYFRDMPSFQEKFNKKCKNLPIKTSEDIYEIYRNKEPIFTHQFPYCDIIKELDNNTHFALLPIEGAKDFWGVLAIGLIGKNMKNIDWEGQTKSEMSTPNKILSAYFTDIDFDKFVAKILKNSDIIDPITEVYRIKEELKKRLELKALNNTSKKIKSEKNLTATGIKKYIMIT